jgi:GNAT superfamily N-acetyltransferase
MLRMRHIDARSPDVDDLVRLILDNPRYRLETQHRMPVPADAMELLQSLPPKASAAQKYVWGLWLGDHMIGYLEVIRQWPHAHHLYIGSLLIAERSQRQGHGRSALAMLAARTHAWSGIRRWRLAVVESQTGAMSFWRDCGFVATGQQQRSPFYPASLHVMEKLVGH